jgi:hypothetical protein
VTFSVKTDLDEGSPSLRVREIREWLYKGSTHPGAFSYRVAAVHVKLRLDFTTLRDAASFADTFGGFAFGAKRATPSDLDAINGR